MSFLAQWKTRQRAVNVWWQDRLIALRSGKSGSNGPSMKSSVEIAMGSWFNGNRKVSNCNGASNLTRSNLCNGANLIFVWLY